MILQRELNAIFYTFYRGARKFGFRRSAPYIGLILINVLLLMAIGVLLCAVTLLLDGHDLVVLMRRPRTLASIVIGLGLVSYFAFATPHRLGFLESDYSDESPAEERHRERFVVVVTISLVLALWALVVLLEARSV